MRLSSTLLFVDLQSRPSGFWSAVHRPASRSLRKTISAGGFWAYRSDVSPIELDFFVSAAHLILPMDVRVQSVLSTPRVSNGSPRQVSFAARLTPAPCPLPFLPPHGESCLRIRPFERAPPAAPLLLHSILYARSTPHAWPCRHW